MVRCSFAFSALAALWACSLQIRKPELADLHATAKAYDAPGGVLTSRNVEGLVQRASSVAIRIDNANVGELVFATVGKLEPELEARGVLQSDQASGRERVSVDASVRLRLPCPGPNRDAPATRAEFGQLDLVTRVDDNVLAEVIQGTAERCVFPAAPSSASATTLDGMLYLGRLGSDRQLLVVFDGTLRNSANPDAALGSFDARLSEGLVETRIELDDTEVIAFVEGTTFGLRDARTRYVCDALARSCVGVDGTALSW